MKKNTFKNPSDKNTENRSKIELLKCPRSGVNCHSHLSDINMSFAKSNDYQHLKEYQLSIQSLKSAYSKTYDLDNANCFQCARFFRSTIINSLEKMHNDLQSMSNSFFRGKRYQGSYVMAKSVLQDLKSSGV